MFKKKMAAFMLTVTTLGGILSGIPGSAAIAGSTGSGSVPLSGCAGTFCVYEDASFKGWKQTGGGSDGWTNTGWIDSNEVSSMLARYSGTYRIYPNADLGGEALIMIVSGLSPSGSTAAGVSNLAGSGWNDTTDSYSWHRS